LIFKIFTDIDLSITGMIPVQIKMAKINYGIKNVKGCI